jgi:hypothetical protein
LTALDGHLAAVEKVNLPPGRIKRVIRWMWNHKIRTLILVSLLSSGGQYGYDLYVTNQAERNAPVVTSIFNADSANVPLAPARDNPADAIGN